MKFVKAIIAALLLAAVMVIGGLDTAQAQTNALPAPTNITVVNGVNPGEVNLTWNVVAGANFYRIGWIAVADAEQARAEGTDWLERFVFVDIKGRTSYTVTRLTPGVDYWFIVASNRERYGPPSWSKWQSLPLNEKAKDTIIFGDLNWSSALLQNRIAQYIVEHGYGYPTNVKFGATLPLFQGLQNGDTHVTMEIWLPNQDEAWNAARDEGAVLSLGQSLGKDWQSAFVIPAYLQEQYPGLDSVADLKDPRYRGLFATPETGGKARLVSCVIGWAYEYVNAAQIRAYGLSEHIQIVNPGDGAALNADLYGAYERREPWLGYQWGTNDPALNLDLVRLEEPAYSDQCWFTTKACAYEDATILIAVNPDLPAHAPDVVAMLRKWDFNVDTVYKDIVRWQAENSTPRSATASATALWWLNNRSDIWSEWVTDEASASIRAALRAGEVPDGWPTR